MINIRMRHNNVLVRRIQPAETSKGGIILHTDAQELPNLGHVISTGPGIKNRKGQIVGRYFDEGDLVLFEKFAGFPLIDTEEPEISYILLKHSEIILNLGKVEIE